MIVGRHRIAANNVSGVVHGEGLSELFLTVCINVVFSTVIAIHFSMRLIVSVSVMYFSLYPTL